MIEHLGFLFTCEGSGCDRSHEINVKSERTAIAKVRDQHWFVGRIRVTSGMKRSKIRTVKRTLCPGCRWLVGAS